MWWIALWFTVKGTTQCTELIFGCYGYLFIWESIKCSMSWMDDAVDFLFLFCCFCLNSLDSLKGEIRNRFILISEERVNIFEQNSENLMKISWKIRKLWHFEVSHIFKKHFLTSRYEYANEWIDDVIASQFYIHLYTEMIQISYFSYENVKLALIPLWI